MRNREMSRGSNRTEKKKMLRQNREKNGSYFEGGA
jgi:hypothetical protein